MKKIWLIAIAGFLLLNHVHAQQRGNESQIGLGLDVAIPVGAYKNTADYGVGVSLLYQKPVAENLTITGNLGYLRFHGPDVFVGIKYKQGFVPLKAGARYVVAKYFYGSGELGVALSTANGYGSGTSFIYVPGIGATIPVSDTGTVDIGLRYENWARSSSTVSFTGIRVGYNF